tara:strand:+ start:221 stop:421 length:201 start_codon:yes stop_codon:yes gene_type:complete
MNKIPTQKQMYYQALRCTSELFIQFDEVMKSDNPPTQDEIKTMIAKNPAYSFMKAYLKPNGVNENG